MLSDSVLIHWLSQRSYVEATDSGAEDPRRFEFINGYAKETFREALSNHIERKKRPRIEGKFVRLEDIQP